MASKANCCMNQECSKYRDIVFFLGGCEECTQPLQKWTPEPPTPEQISRLISAMGFHNLAWLYERSHERDPTWAQAGIDFHKLVQEVINEDPVALKKMEVMMRVARIPIEVV